MSQDLVKYIQSLEAQLQSDMVAERLLSNPDFIEVFERGYCDKHLKALVDQRATVTSVLELEQLTKRIDSVAYFRQYLQQLKTAKGNTLATLQQANESLTHESTEQ